MPRLHLRPDDDFHFAIVLAASIEKWLQDTVDGQRQLRAEWAHIIEEDVKSVGGVISPSDDEGAKGRLKSHLCKRLDDGCG